MKVRPTTADELAKALPAQLLGVGTVVEYPRGGVVFRQGEKNEHVFVIEQGLLKGVYLTADGKEFTKTLIKEGDFIASLVAQEPGGSASFSLVCLEPVRAIRVPISALEKRAESDHQAALSLVRLLKALALKKERREYELLCLSAEQRFQLLLERAPDLVERVTQNEIAHYLGVTPVALSRIRSRLQKRGG